MQVVDLLDLLGSRGSDRAESHPLGSLVDDRGDELLDQGQAVVQHRDRRHRVRLATRVYDPGPDAVLLRPELECRLLCLARPLAGFVVDHRGQLHDPVGALLLLHLAQPRVGRTDRFEPPVEHRLTAELLVRPDLVELAQRDRQRVSGSQRLGHRGPEPVDGVQHLLGRAERRDRRVLGLRSRGPGAEQLDNGLPESTVRVHPLGKRRQVVQGLDQAVHRSHGLARAVRVEDRTQGLGDLSLGCLQPLVVVPADLHQALDRNPAHRLRGDVRLFAAVRLAQHGADVAQQAQRDRAFLFGPEVLQPQGEQGTFRQQRYVVRRWPDPVSLEDGHSGTVPARRPAWRSVSGM